MAGPLGGAGLIYAEALSFALTDRMPRPEAQAAVKELCQRVMAGEGSLPGLALERWPDLPQTVFDPAARTGQAPAEARAFAQAVAERGAADA